MPIKLNFRIILFSPWFVIHALLREECGEKPNTVRLIWFVVLILSQWLLFYLSCGNYVIGFASANLAIMGFLLSNLYLQLHPDEYSNGDAAFLNSAGLRGVVAISAVIHQYLFAGIPFLLVNTTGISNFSIFDDVIFSWSNPQKCFGGGLILVWFLFVVVDQFEIFKAFPRGRKRLWASKLRVVDKFVIIFVGLVFGSGWTLLYEMRLFFF